ncbi:type II toxin-antitoxin system RelE/ParE family toxin [Candidatus Tisiphia endosymbiont of Melanophora roralis]|jgi:toxin ParE1/3/4|uniref:type II toxin-antitoxin system RelE/ParE family toxin n=1 Tax=Candidatus Tisiphia endosymbiont of Melanophora roralis TaxID=3066261 RepID=UPI003977DE3F
MVQCKFTNSAKRDLEDITDYTLKHWGRQQTIKYLDEIHNKAIALSLNPNIGTLRNDIYPTLLSFPTKKHILDFFRNSTSAGDLYVDAVLESSRTLEYAAVLRSASPSNPSA